MKLIQRYPALRKASLKSLQAFESAYLHQSFATAAQELSVTASAISHAILALESVLGVHLFNRGHKGATPTRKPEHSFIRHSSARSPKSTGKCNRSPIDRQHNSSSRCNPRRVSHISGYCHGCRNSSAAIPTSTSDSGPSTTHPTSATTDWV